MIDRVRIIKSLIIILSMLLSVCLCVTGVGVAITNLWAAVGKNHKVHLNFKK